MCASHFTASMSSIIIFLFSPFPSLSFPHWMDHGWMMVDQTERFGTSGLLEPLAMAHLLLPLHRQFQHSNSRQGRRGTRKGRRTGAGRGRRRTGWCVPSRSSINLRSISIPDSLGRPTQRRSEQPSPSCCNAPIIFRQPATTREIRKVNRLDSTTHTLFLLRSGLSGG